MKLSKRLQLLADVINKYKQGNRLADIGSDHAYLPCYLVEQQIVCHVYACDVASGPLQSAKDTILQYGMQNQVTPLLGSGLAPIVDKEVDMISISGMGAYLITEILEAHYDYLKNIRVLFLQANANTDHLRSYLFAHHFQIIDEQMVKEGGHIYEVMVVTKQTNKDIVYSKMDVEFGPILSNVRSSLFKEKWTKQYKVFNTIKDTLPNSHPRYLEIDRKMKMIEEILHESK